MTGVPRNAPTPVRRAGAFVVGAALALAGAGCTRSSTDLEKVPGGDAPAAAPAARSHPAGSIGTLHDLCGPGNAHGATARGVTDKTITVGTSADPGGSVAPGLGQEFFDVADAFVTWCNAAGGINGRRLVLHKHDGKLFESAAAVLQACRTDFMLVGNGNPLDEPTVRPRLACGLGQVPAYTVSPQATKAALQVQPQPNPANEYPVGQYLRMAQLFPDAQRHFGIGGSNVASIRPQGERLRDAVAQIGYRTVDYQEQPPLIDNWRPYAERFRSSGVRGLEEVQAQTLQPLVTAMNNIGWKPDFLIAQAQFYDPKTIKAARTVSFPPTWVYLNSWPFELADQNPAARAIIDILHARHPTAPLTDFTGLAFNAWLLWADAARTCGSQLTVGCVLDHAASYPAWTAGGFVAPRNTDPADAHQSECFLMMRVTPQGFVYDRKTTAPNDGIYNCSPANVVPLTG